MEQRPPAEAVEICFESCAGQMPGARNRCKVTKTIWSLLLLSPFRRRAHFFLKIAKCKTMFMCVYLLYMCMFLYKTKRNG